MSLLRRFTCVIRCIKHGNVLLFRAKATQVPRQMQVSKASSFGEGGYLLLIVPLTAFGLGTWQVKRREWKLKLIEELDTKATEPPIPLPIDLAELVSLEYRSVTVRGRFDHSKEMIIGPRSNVLAAKEGTVVSNPTTGVNIITPFILSDRNLTILVNRGWVPPKYTKAESRPKGQIEGEIELTGVVRHEEKKFTFVPMKNNQNGNYYLYRCLSELAENAGSSEVFIDANKASSINGGPLGGQTRINLRNEHAAYIITWYSLAAFTAVMWKRRYFRPRTPDSIFTIVKK